MRKRFRNSRFILRRIGFYIPFTWYFVLFCVAGIIGYQWLQSQAGIPDSAYKDIFALLLRFAILFVISIFSVALLTVLISFLFFSWKKRKTGIDFRITTPSREDSAQPKQTVAFYIHPVLKPLLGFVKVRLKYDSIHFSEKFLIVKRADKKVFSTTINGVYNWQLPEIKEYRIDKAIIYFEDFFQFFSIAITINASNSFHTQPATRSSKMIKAFPRKTEETSTRIEELKKVEGELINYKNFESNDDVRRIVWKIYAKNKELVVRIPEILDPYASHMYLYPSFFTSLNVQGNEVVEIPFLNHYKTVIWSVYKQLLQKGYEVKYIPDQDVSQTQMESAEEQVKYSISVSRWQTELELRDYVKTRDASVIVISSLSDVAQVQELIEAHGSEISFIFIPLTESFNRQHFGDWIQWLFIQQEKEKAAVYKTNWSLSLLRLKVAKNEKQLKQLLEQYDRSTVLKKNA